MIQRSELARLLAWLDTLPDDELQDRPLLALYYAWGLFLSGQIKHAITRLQAVEDMLATNEATLTGVIRDQAELAGVLTKVFDLNLTLLAVNRIAAPSN